MIVLRTKLESGADHPARERLLRLRQLYKEDEEKAWPLYNAIAEVEAAKVRRALQELRQWLYGP